MIQGIGCDIVKVSRFNKKGEFLNHFIKRSMTTREMEELAKNLADLNQNKLILEVATRFAGKEAVSKALGTGFQNGITLKDIEITHDNLGAPFVTLYNKALARAYMLTTNRQFKIHITLTNEREYANAVVVLESE